jgi:UDP-N-acetyl-D-mannosaminuronic acid dehydrogenase
LGNNKKPDLSFLLKGIEDIGNLIRKNTLVVIGSTVPPGTSCNVVKPRLEFLTNLAAEEEFYLAYVPERIAPGNALTEFVESPRLIGGIGPNSTRIGAELYRSVCKKVLETNATVAEVAKLAENTYRDINIAFANQLALICEKLGADVEQVIALADTHPRVNIHKPGPGVGGPCLTKDPYFLSCSSKILSQDLIQTSREINDYMPSHIVESILQGLKYADKEVKDSRISILGTAYKSEIDDSRLSPAKPIIGQLLQLCAKVTAYDPYSSERFGANSASSLQDAIRNADSIVILTDHLEFKSLDLEKIRKLMNVRPSIIDGRRVVDPLKANGLDFIYYGIGFGWLLR